MAHFIGYLQGSRSRVSRLGTPASGITATAQGWNIGGEVTVSVDQDGNDVVEFVLTTGSNARGFKTIVAQYVNGKKVA